MEFQSFNKIPRLSRPIIITEKLDGTNAQVAITDNCEAMWIGSRNKWLASIHFNFDAVGDFMEWHRKDSKGCGLDNYGFANWAYKNRKELSKLGPGRHFGEWWGQGIQRGYNINDKRFSLFNVHRWNAENLPSCCNVVPILATLDEFNSSQIAYQMDILRATGSFAAPFYMNPEGIIVYHTQSGHLFKKTFEKDEGKDVQV